MSQPTLPEPHVAAADPAAPPHILASIVATYPELAPVVRANPACYPELAEYIDTQLSVAVPPESAAPPRQRRPWRTLGVASVLVLALGIFGGGFYLGWTAQGEISGRQDSATPYEAPAPTGGSDPSAAPTAAAGYPMPDVRGLTTETATTVLADLAVAPGAVRLVEQAAAGPAGVVIEQSPVHGAEPIADVTLTVTIPTTVPDVAGRTRDEVIDELAKLGAEVVEEFSYVPGQSAGTVLSSEPAAGQPLPASVKIVVAESPAVVHLAELSTVDGSCSTDETSIDGGQFDRSVVCRASGDESSVSWVVARAAERLRGVVGVPDTGLPSTKVRVKIFGDGKELKAVTAKYGDAVDLDVPIDGVLRLTVSVRLTNGEDDWSSSDVAFGDLRLEGGTVAMSVLGEAAP